MSNFNYYAEVSNFMKKIYSVNRTWFEMRQHLTDEDMKQIFKLTLDITNSLTAIRQIMIQKKRGGELNDRSEEPKRVNPDLPW